jgi:hypothetical protein
LAEAVIMVDANTATAANVIFMMAFIFDICFGWLVDELKSILLYKLLMSQ